MKYYMVFSDRRIVLFIYFYLGMNDEDSEHKKNRGLEELDEKSSKRKK